MPEHAHDGSAAVDDKRNHVAAALAPMTQAVLADLDALTDRLVEALQSRDGAYEEALVQPEDLWQSCRGNLERALRHLAGAHPHTETDVETAYDTGRRRAEQHFPLEHLLHAYRVGGGLVWEALLEQARRSGPQMMEVLAEAASQVWDIVDAYSAAVGQAYRTRAAELRRHDEDQLLLLIDGLLEGRGGDPTFAREAASALGVSENGRFVVAVIRRGASDSPSPSLSAALDVRWRLRNTEHIAIIPMATTTLEALRLALQATRAGPAGLSPVVHGMAELSQAHLWAQLAAATAHDGEVVELDEHLPQAFLALNGALRDRLVRRVHAGLDVPALEAQQVLDTVDAYLAESLSATATAAKLFCHPNTVLNRIRRFESLTGRSLRHVPDLVEVALARAASRQQADGGTAAPTT
jgi:hypothetical protein